MKIALLLALFWQTPESLSEPGHVATMPEIEINSRGDRSTCLWSESCERDYLIYSRECVDGRWDSKRALSSPGQISSLPSLATNEAGDAFAIWMTSKGRGSPTYIEARERVDGQWGEVALLSQPELSSSAPEICYSNSQIALATWEEFNRELGTIQLCGRIYKDKRWGETMTISSEHAAIVQSRCAMNERGDAVAVWTIYKQRRPYITDIYAAHYSEAIESWSAPQLLSSGNAQVAFPEVSINGMGDALVAWQLIGEASAAIQACFFTRGGWSQAETISNSDEQSSVFCVKLNDLGHAIALWATYGESKCCKASFYRDRWHAPETLVSGDLPIQHASLSLNNLDQAVALWSFKEKKTGWIQTASFNNGSWEFPQGVAEAAPRAIAKVALSESGRALAIFSDNHAALQLSSGIE